jgi:Cytosol aminopeptidase family, N-terminal domain
LTKNTFIPWPIVFCFVVGLLYGSVSTAQTAATANAAASKAKDIPIQGAPIPIRVLVQSPAETVTDLQIICLFESSPENTLHGSLIELNEKLLGLLDQIRKPTLFRGEFGETLLLSPSAGTLGAKKLLIIGLGDSPHFAPSRMELVGSILYRESNRLGIADPIFAATVLDGGVTKFSTGDVAENFVHGFLRAMRTEKVLGNEGASQTDLPRSITVLAGPTHAVETQQGIQRALASKAE